MSNVGDIISEDADTRTLAPEAVASQVLLMAVISAGTIIAFNILRPKNKIVYEPKVKYHVGDKKPPRISSSILGWISPLARTKEAELVDKIGLDASAFLRFLRMMRWIYTGVAAVTCAVLIPVNVTYNLKNIDSKDRTLLSLLTIRDVSGNILFVHVGAVYMVTMVVLIGIWYNWRAMVRLRRQWFRSPEYTQSFYARTLAVTKVPKKYQSDEGIRAVFETVQVPYPTTSVHIGRRVGKLPELIEYHNETVRELEKVLVRYLKGGKIAKERPTIRIGGFMGIGGTKKDAIDFYTAKLKRMEQSVEDYRNQIDTRKPESYGFASMAAVPYAHVVAQLLQRKHPKGTTIMLAPNPKDIIWENLNKSDGEILRKKTMGWIWLVVVCFFNTVPLFVISILANLSSLTSFVPFLQNWSDSSPRSFNIVSGVLPPAVSAIFGFFLPITMRWLSQYQGATTHSRLDRAVLARYFAFLVISQLIIFTLIGVIFNSVKEVIDQIGQHKSFQEIVDNLNKLPATINRTYIDQSSYWLTFFPLRGFLAVFDLAQIINLVLIFFKTHLFGRTPRDIREWTQPPEFQYSIYYSNILFMGTVGLVFAPLAPLVAVAAAIVFWISSWVYKYQLMFVFVSKVETGGRLWNPVINRLLVSLLLMQALMVLTIGLQYGWTSFAWVATVPPIIIVMLFKVYTNRVFDRPFRYYVPTEDELRQAKVHSQRADMSGNRLEKRFGHPALHAELFTPMLHAKMMPLLSEVYKGKISHGQAKVEEYGGQSLQAQVIPGGIRIAAVDQNNLEYDPALYQRDRGELDWDARSMSTTMMMSDNASIYPSKVPMYEGGRASPVPTLVPGYDRYLSRGPQQSEIELSRLDLNYNDQQPLLPPGQSTVSLPGYASPPQAMYQSPAQQYPPAQPAAYNGAGLVVGDGFREAPIHRPYPSQQGSYASQQRPYPPSQNGSSGSWAQPPPTEQGEVNMAGRGTFRR
ncbi:hypothetical protein HETIRDRAFT_482685 [Heterobasidion irregulare TC 32-1]|uniref:DUF221-domain-containing protein n=1 Tax=Heterobasidion irregulare (strain TC 32-1) TaxID=747525 RepID=W4JN36_HETIT|nr:uncharacterized protein HETIRDRAFT_482685 [Heterobasidion irregulare TC 32-1]ETW74884.1 hypothetical protein HETIRDRAFT_482685 [Heterobasidion irregulare TC 32-1]